MTLDEAIKHCEEKAKELRKEADLFSNSPAYSESTTADCLECAKEHEQLAEWLKELKAYKEASNNDLISRTELKKCAIPCQIHNGALTDLCVPLYQINNAPTVERPQGEWIDGYCNKCGGSTLCDGWGMDVESRFCPNCGAKMKKGGAE